ncbi:hypothetical protein CYMTET_18327 [Cymbomonas tetramitiformis]|uniref:tRNA(Ile)-lysidine synthetase n=1 Tax=Cymbomonas tetramitiformis TaxID=36881 RepID=A0AAE0G8C7_9CHLO|nr:hypothetical protein CYMTET_18327 [Cymbomonas tetramitiformis]
MFRFGSLKGNIYLRAYNFIHLLESTNTCIPLHCRSSGHARDYVGRRSRCRSSSLQSAPYLRRNVRAAKPSTVFRANSSYRAEPSRNSSVVEAVEVALRDNIGIRKGDRLIVCVSGGCDSVALLHALAKLQATWRLDLHVLHFNHGLREESSEEQIFVESLSLGLQLPFHLRQCTKGWGSSGLQNTARDWRRTESRALLQELDGQGIMLGHHQDDQVETMLMKLLRGCHVSHLRGMAWHEGPFMRPLLGCSKEQLEGFLLQGGMEWRDDPSNLTLKYKRNRVRHQLIPLLQELANGALAARLDEMTDQSVQLREWLDQQPEVFQQDAANREPYLDIAQWLGLPRLVQSDQLNRFITGVTGEPMRHSVVQQLCAKLAGDSGTAIWEWHVSQDWRAHRQGSRLILRPRRNGSAEKQSSDSEPGRSTITALGNDGIEVEHPAQWQAGGRKGVGMRTRQVEARWLEPEDVEAYRRSLERRKRAADTRATPSKLPEEPTADAVVEMEVAREQMFEGMLLYNLPRCCVLQVGRRQPGDRFRRSGSGAKELKLKDLLRSAKVPLYMRDRIPVIRLDGEVIAVYPDHRNIKVAPDSDLVGFANMPAVYIHIAQY